MQDMLEIRKNPDNIRNLVQEHNSANAEEVYPETDPSIPDEDVGLPSERQEFVGEDVPNSIENINEGNVGADDQQSLATSNWTVSSDDFIQLQMDREKEFLEYICEPLEALVMQAQENGGDEHEMLIAAEMAQKIVDEVADQLRNEVNKQLVGFEPTSLEDFDNKLVDILQARELITQLEEVRDNMFAQEVSGNNIQEPVVESEVVSVPDIAALEEIGVDAKLEEPPGDIQNPNISAIQSELPTASISAPPSTRPSTAGSSSSLTVDSYSNLQKDRESEFLELLCQPLDVLPTDTQVAVKHELSIALRVKVCFAIMQLLVYMLCSCSSFLFLHFSFNHSTTYMIIHYIVE